MRRIGVLASGGDAPGMNAAIRAVVRTAAAADIGVAGIRRGYHGLIYGLLEPMDRRSVGNIIQRGGSILGTARSEEFRTLEGRERARETARREGLEGLVLIGGDGTFRGGQTFTEEGGPPCVGIPGSIDNDIHGTDPSLGFDTAVNTALEAVDRIRDTAASLELLHFVEVMGRRSGWIALATAVAGGAEDVLLPETPTDVAALASRIERDLAAGKRGVIVVVAEGDEEGGAARVARSLGELLDLDYRVTILGHIQRGGSPTAGDRILGSLLGAAAVDALREGATGHMVGLVRGELTLTPFAETGLGPQLDPRLIRLIPLLA